MNIGIRPLTCAWAYVLVIWEGFSRRVINSTLTANYRLLLSGLPAERIIGSKSNDHFWYRTHSGTLNYYASAMRYDIAYATSRLSQFNARPTEGSKAALLRVLGYLNTTSRAPRICGRFSSQPDKVRIYSDSDHGGLRFVDGRSQSGLIVVWSCS